MDSYSKFIEFLISKGYKLIRNDERLGVTIYEHEGLFVKIVQEHGQRRFIDLSRTNNHPSQGWYDMDIIYHFIQKIHYQKSSPSRFDPLSHFFIDHYDEIIDAFSSANFHDTEIELSALKKERGKVLFGD